jgi:hypothetical protein
VIRQPLVDFGINRGHFLLQKIQLGQQTTHQKAVMIPHPPLQGFFQLIQLLLQAPTGQGRHIAGGQVAHQQRFQHCPRRHALNVRNDRFETGS